MESEEFVWSEDDFSWQASSCEGFWAFSRDANVFDEHAAKHGHAWAVEVS